MTTVSFTTRLASLVIIALCLLSLIADGWMWAAASGTFFWMGIAVVLGIVSFAIEIEHKNAH